MIERISGLDPSHPPHLFVGLKDKDYQNALDAVTHMRDLVGHITMIGHALDLMEWSEDQIQRISAARLELDQRRKDQFAKPPIDLEVMAGIADESERLDQAKRRHLDWKAMARRDIPMRVSDFQKSLGLSKTHFERVTSLHSRQDGKGMNAAMILFNEYFPAAHDLRNAAGHPVDYFAKDHDKKRNSVKGGIDEHRMKIAPGPSVGFSDIAFEDGTLAYTGDGRAMTMTLDRSIVEKLIEVKVAFFAATAATAAAA